MAKKLGCVVEYAQDRINALMAEYERCIGSRTFIFLPDVCRYIVDRPCPRFWVSNTRAAIVIGNMMKGDDLSYMRSNKREMFQEIFRRVMDLKMLHPEMSLFKLVSLVVESPAPKFYLTPGSAKIMMSKAKKEWYKKKWRKPRH